MTLLAHSTLCDGCCDEIGPHDEEPIELAGGTVHFHVDCATEDVLATGAVIAAMIAEVTSA